MELNTPLLLFVLTLFRPPIPPQLIVLNLIADNPFLFTPLVVCGAGSNYLCLKDVMEEENDVNIFLCNKEFVKGIIII